MARVLFGILFIRVQDLFGIYGQYFIGYIVCGMLVTFLHKNMLEKAYYMCVQDLISISLTFIYIYMCVERFAYICVVQKQLDSLNHCQFKYKYFY